jgi:beta-lactamase class A
MINGKKRYSLVLFITTFTSLVVLLFFSFQYFPNTFQSRPKEVLSSTLTSSITPTNTKTQKVSLASTVQQSMKDTKGTYGIVIKDLSSNEMYTMNDTTKFDSASLYKLWVMAVVYQQIEKGVLQKDQILSRDISVLNDKFRIATESAEQKEGTLTLSVNDALTQMITISHNYAAFLLAEKVRLSNIASFLKVNGFAQSSVGIDGSQPTSTAHDTALFFEKLYNGQLANTQATKEMIDLLKGQRLNKKLPKYLPAGTFIAHKTGEITSFSHDAGIVYSPNGDYIIVVMSKSTYPPGAVERMAVLSKNVYTYFTQE